jgi:hypothetical protein
MKHIITDDNNTDWVVTIYRHIRKYSATSSDGRTVGAGNYRQLLERILAR